MTSLDDHVLQLELEIWKNLWKNVTSERRAGQPTLHVKWGELGTFHPYGSDEACL